MAKRRAAVIGAGLAGAAAARALSDRGVEVVLFDKGLGPGGRMSTRRAETPLGLIHFDHGAQFLTATGEGFTRLLKDAEAQGAAGLWTARTVSIDRGGNAESLREKTRWVGVPGMSAIVKTALSGFDARFGVRARRVRGDAGAWTIHFEDGHVEGPFDRVVLTLPPEQLIEFLARSDGDFSDLIAEALNAKLSPCWAVMTVPGNPADLGFDGAKLLGGAVRWMARMNSRPGQDGPDAWVLHASPDWSEAFLESDPETVARALTEEAFIRFGLPMPEWCEAHRWRYALVTEAPGTPFALDPTGTLGCAGDWRLGPRAELAWDSGDALGDALAD
ncbi:NAD(P)/FAD-dependent oxidoreductase [Oceanicaulis sp. LC35]|uniref:NAD(P)/FAD-dependent oxidoreductase n=1 Tax=Oceanicaulis sp. LC35 TaxID=3349635 RepID=UPI003F85C765